MSKDSIIVMFGWVLLRIRGEERDNGKRDLRDDFVCNIRTRHAVEIASNFHHTTFWVIERKPSGRRRVGTQRRYRIFCVEIGASFPQCSLNKFRVVYYYRRHRFYYSWLFLYSYFFSFELSSWYFLTMKRWRKEFSEMLGKTSSKKVKRGKK